ncbi:MFS transporter [Chengkuizengella sediminis]|uniref:MFS transporter n=1 Tax=Chengkuizengella sediminis TaxID=1885917 RepID=UPI00138A4703|nr:MFS transporter [Chengkuizengella sediminis]NDI35713.1 MFS transporter [Chengkuizengella sediminis]
MPMSHEKHYFPNRWIKTKDQQEHSYFQNHEPENHQNHKEGKLTKQAILLLAVHGLFAAANALSGTFVNVYLWKVSNDLSLIGWFSLSHQVVNILTFWLAGKWVKEHNKMNSLRLGVGLSAVFYLFVLLLQKQAVDYVLLLGAVQGMAAGFFWLAFNVVYFEITGPNDRDKFNGYAGLLGSGAGMFAPWISGLVITQMKATSGYKIIFSISLIVFVIGVIVSFFLKKREPKGTYQWFAAFQRLKEKRNPWRKAFLALMAQGIREGVFTFIIGLLVYIATKNEMKLGNYSLIVSAVALVSYMFMGKYLKPWHRNRAMFIGTIFMIVVIFPFFWDISYMTLLIFGIGTSIFLPLFTIPMTSTVFDIIGRDDESAQQRVEYVVLREAGLNAGRILGTLIFILIITWSNKPIVLNVFLLCIGSSPLLAWYFMRELMPTRPQTVNSKQK